MRYTLRLGGSFGPGAGTTCHTLRYDTKPASIVYDEQHPGSLALAGANAMARHAKVQFDHKNGGGRKSSFGGNARDGKPGECVLILDPATSSIVIERVATSTYLRHDPDPSFMSASDDARSGTAGRGVPGGIGWDELDRRAVRVIPPPAVHRRQGPIDGLPCEPLSDQRMPENARKRISCESQNAKAGSESQLQNDLHSANNSDRSDGDGSNGAKRPKRGVSDSPAQMAVVGDHGNSSDDLSDSE